jgi:hydroxymethylpyrimidine/phosphomethylpyrimidine kinase
VGPFPGPRPPPSPTLTGMESRPVPTVLSIAGSDSGGGAGIQADLKAFARCGVHGMTAITALTAQSTTGVTGIHPVPGEFVVEQVRAVAEDIGVDAVKVGMLGTAETVAAVREALALLPAGTPVVIDPVMVAESGAVLLDDAARAALVELLLPLATVITPNLPEARVLAATGDAAAGARDAAGPAARGESASDDAERLARRLRALGPDVVVVTGGHRVLAEDLVLDEDGLHRIPGERYADGAAHGSGCTHSSVLAAHLALSHTPLEAARAARRIAGEAVRDGLRGLGAGAGPVDVLSLTRRARTAPRATDVATPLA